MNIRPRVRCLSNVLAIPLIVSTAVPGVAQDVPVSRLEAAIVSKLPQFIEWPPAAIDERTSIDICVAAPDPFGRDLEELVGGQSLKGRALTLRHVNGSGDVASCHVLFLPRRPNGAHPLLRTAADRPILTVSDDPRFLDQGGIVALRIVDGRVRFDIDAGAAQRVGLRISSQLLGLAMSVRGNPS